MISKIHSIGKFKYYASYDDDRSILHRIDGPAIENRDEPNTEEYWIDGKEYWPLIIISNFLEFIYAHRID